MEEHRPALLPVIFLLLGVCLLQPQVAEGFVPKACITNTTAPNARCCPRDPGNGQECGGPMRGECVRVTPCNEEIPEVYKIDDRVAFPNRFFTYMCQCRENFWGPSCGECNFHRTGRDCSQQRLCTRRNIQLMSPKEKHDFQVLFTLSYHAPSGYYIHIEDNWKFVDPVNQIQLIPANVHYLMNFVHRFVSRQTMFNNDDDGQICEQFGILDFGHGSCAFVAWHRYLTLLWERFFKDLAKQYLGLDDWCMPYWNWLDQEDCDICTDEIACRTGEADDYGFRLSRNCPFYDFKEYCTEDTDSSTQCTGCHTNPTFGRLTRRKRTDCTFPRVSEIRPILNLAPPFTRPNDREDVPGGGCISAAAAIEGSCTYRQPADEFPGAHNLVHVCFEGSMCCGATANSDCLFPLHHCTVDWIFTLWQSIHGNGEIPIEGCRPGHHRDCYLTGLVPLKRVGEMMVNSRDLGYTYDFMTLGTTDNHRAQQGK